MRASREDLLTNGLFVLTAGALVGGFLAAALGNAGAGDWFWRAGIAAATLLSASALQSRHRTTLIGQQRTGRG